MRTRRLQSVPGFFVVILLLLPITSSAQWEHIGLQGARVNALILEEEVVVVATDSGIWEGVESAGSYEWSCLGLEDIHIRDALILDDGSLLACRFPTSNFADTLGILFKRTPGTSEWDTLCHSWSWMKRLGAPYLSSDTLLASGKEYLMQSVDGGLTWVPNGTSIGYTGHFFHFPSADENTFWSGGENDFFHPYLIRSTDRGVTWESIAVDVGGDNACHDIVSDPSNDDRLWVGMEGYVMYTEDGGESWTLNDEPIPYVYNMDMDPRDPDILYASGTLFRNGEIQKLYRSTDGGESWTDISNINENAAASILCGESHIVDGAMELFFGTTSDGVWRFRDGESAVIQTSVILTDPTLHRVYPNPFNASTSFSFTLRNSERMNVTVYNMLGRQVAVLAQGFYTPGEHRISFYGGQLTNGVYILRAQALEKGWSASQKVVLIK